MAQIDTVKTWVPGDSVDAAGMNNIIDQASALDGIITAQPVFEPATIDVANDRVLLHDASASALRKALISALPQGVTSVAMTVAPTAIFSVAVANPTGAAAIAFTTKPQLANAVLAGPVTGSGIPTFRALAPKDIPSTTVAIAVAQIDWDLGSTFSKTLTGSITFSFTNANAGQTIRVLILQDASHTVAFPVGVRWPGGTVPVMTTGAGRVDIFTFHFIGGVFYGTANQNFL